MSFPGEVSSSRRRLMQLALWLVLGATVALAAMVSHLQRRARHVELSSDATTWRHLTYRLPAEWRVRAPTRTDARVIVEAVEPPGKRPSRVLSLVHDELSSLASPVSYLWRNLELDRGVAEIVEYRQVAIGGWPGVAAALSFGGSGQPARKQLVVCAVLPSHRVVAIRIEGAGPIELTDYDMVRHVAHAIKIQDEPDLSDPGAPIELGHGITLDAPPEFRVASEPDRAVLHRTLWGTGELWSAVELTPCVVLADVGNSSAVGAELVTLLVTRDVRWRNARTVRLDPRQFRVEPTGDIDARAYVAIDETGAALLAINHGADERADDLWRRIQSTARFSGSIDLQQLARVGALEALRLREIPLDHLLAGDREEQWYSWSNDTNQPHVGWSHLEWSVNELSARTQTRIRPTPARLVRISESWSASGDWSRFRADVMRNDSELAPLRQRVELSEKLLTVSVWSGPRMVDSWRVNLPENYLPGPLLPHLLPKLSPAPMLLTTDSFVGSEGVGPAALMKLLITHDDSGPLRCVKVEVVGTGYLSRWYHNGDGELQYVEFPRRLQRLEGRETTIRYEFAHDPEMLP